MGQRLNVEIAENEKTLANAYYHWSGYTSSALSITKGILEKIDSINFEDRVVNAIKLLEETGAGLTGPEKIYASHNLKDYEKYQFKNAANRNQGLIAISPEGIDDTRAWEEARVTIYLDTKTIAFAAVCSESKDGFLKYNDQKSYDALDVIEDDFDDIPFSEFDAFSEKLIACIKNESYTLKKPDGSIYTMIE